MFSVKGKVAIVTGGASGIGLATVKELLKEGARGVTIADINDNAGVAAVLDLRKDFGPEKTIFVHTDVSNKRSFEDAFKRTLATFKNIDILVNNAGVFDDKEYEKEIAVNLTGATHGIVLGMEKYISKYKTESDGVIISTASIAGVRNLPCVPMYSATKSGVIAITTTIGHKQQYDKNNVKIVAIAPGYTTTKLANEVMDHWVGMFNETCINLAQEDQKHYVDGQTPEFVATKIIEIIQTKPTGTVWIVEEGKDPVEFTRPKPHYECE